MTQFGPTASVRNGGLSNGREIGAYAIAQAIKIALLNTVALSGLLGPIYAAMARAFVGSAQRAVGFAGLTTFLSALWTALAFVLFMVFRGVIGGTPVAVGGPGQGHAVITRGGEVGAFALAYAIVVVVLMGLNALVLAPIYAELYRSGGRFASFGFGVAVSIVAATIVYAIFIALRRPFCPARP